MPRPQTSPVKFVGFHMPSKSRPAADFSVPDERYLMSKRTDIRQQFGIEGSQCGDCCTAYWCPCCVLIQHENEVTGRTQYAPVTEGYQSQGDNMKMQGM